MMSLRSASNLSWVVNRRFFDVKWKRVLSKERYRTINQVSVTVPFLVLRLTVGPTDADYKYVQSLMTCPRHGARQIRQTGSPLPSAASTTNPSISNTSASTDDIHFYVGAQHAAPHVRTMSALTVYTQLPNATSSRLLSPSDPAKTASSSPTKSHAPSHAFHRPRLRKASPGIHERRPLHRLRSRQPAHDH